MRAHQDDSAPSFAQFTKFWWNELAKKVLAAVVFVDNASAECLHWNCGGAAFLFQSGALGVRELSSFESEKDARKAVFVVSEAVNGAAEMSVRDIILASRFEHCIVVTAAPATVHAAPVRLGPESHVEDDPNNLRAFVELERRLLRWMGSEDLTAEVFYCPLFAAQLLDDFFITPLFADLTPSLSHLKPGSQPVEKILDKKIRGRMHHIAACLHSLLAFLGAREDMFSVGTLGAALMAELEALPAARARRKTADKKVALVVVDRGLDLAAAGSLDTSSCLLDRVLSVLPNFHGHCSERAVNMGPLCNAYSEMDPLLPTCIAPGCALQPAGLGLLLESRSCKEGLMALQRRFLQAAPGNATLRVTPDSMAKRAKALAQEKGLRQHSELLQQCLGVLQSMTGAESSNLDTLAGLQKVLVQNLAIGGEERGLADVMSQVVSLLKTRKERGLSMKSVLLLLIQSFSLAGPDQAERPDSQEQAEQLRQTLAHVMLEDGLDAWGQEIKDECQASEVSTELVQKLFDIAKARQGLTKYREVLHQPSAQLAAEVRPLLPRILADCLDSMRPELGPDVVSVATGSLRNTLGMFLSAAKAHPSDSPLLVFLVLGGITGAELRSLRTVAAQLGKKVLVAATSLAAPQDLMHYLRPPLS